jgi:hypothetical protein
MAKDALVPYVYPPPHCGLFVDPEKEETVRF